MYFRLFFRTSSLLVSCWYCIGLLRQIWCVPSQAVEQEINPDEEVRHAAHALRKRGEPLVSLIWSQHPVLFYPHRLSTCRACSRKLTMQNSAGAVQTLQRDRSVLL